MRRPLLLLPAIGLFLTGCPEDVPVVDCTWQQPSAEIDRLSTDEGVTLRIAVTGEFTAETLPAVHFFSDRDGLLVESGIAIGEEGCVVDGCPAGDRYEGTLTPGEHRLFAQALTPLATVACEAERVITVNTPPTVDGITFTPAAPVTADDIEVTATGVDSDFDDEVTLSVLWSGPDGQELLGETLTSINTAAGQTWTATVTPRDGLDTGASATADILIGNTAPDAPSVAIGPDPGREDALLNCWVTNLDDLDPDDQELTVGWSWTVDGDDAEVATDTVTPDLIGPDEVWVCSATVNDGEATSGAGSATTTVAPALDIPSSLDLEDGTVITGTNGGQFVGDFRTVGSPGDLDGDGLAEFVITVNDEVCDTFCNGNGYAYLFNGSDPLGADVETASATFIGPIGFRVYAPWPVGDLNGDGLDDLVIPHRSVTSATSEGGSSVFVVFGDEDGFVGEIVLDDLTDTGAATRIKNLEFEAMGTVPCPLGDLDGDGFDDLGLSAPDADFGTGRLYVVYGHPGAWLSGLTVADLTPGFRIVGAGAGQAMGQACAGPIDVDGNGYDDVVVAATGAAAQGQGRVLVYLMDGERLSGEFTSAVADTIIDGDPASIGGFGAGLASLGDHDGDGRDDFAIYEFGPELTNPDPPPNDWQAGTVHIVSTGDDSFGPAMSVSSLPHHIVGDGDLGFCGHPVGVDLDGDGLGDLVCGDTRPHRALGLDAPARVRVFFGGSGLAENRDYDDADLVLNSPSHDHFAGLAVVGVPDRDGDGYDELLVGASGRDGPLTDSGGVYLINLAD